MSGVTPGCWYCHLSVLSASPAQHALHLPLLCCRSSCIGMPGGLLAVHVTCTAAKSKLRRSAAASWYGDATLTGRSLATVQPCLAVLTVAVAGVLLRRLARCSCPTVGCVTSSCPRWWRRWRPAPSSPASTWPVSSPSISCFGSYVPTEHGTAPVQCLWLPAARTWLMCARWPMQAHPHSQRMRSVIVTQQPEAEL